MKILDLKKAIWIMYCLQSLRAQATYICGSLIKQARFLAAHACTHMRSMWYIYANAHSSAQAWW
jgi:hypothetical protein